MHRSNTPLLFVALALLGVTIPLPGQVVRGEVTDSITHVPIPGAVVMLLDSNEREVGRTVADESGLFLIRAVVASGYRLMVQLAGYRSSTFPPFDLGPDEVKGFMLLVASLEPTPAEITAEEFVAEICEEGSVQPGQGVVYGFVLEADSHEPLPNTLVKVIWAAISGGLAGLTGVNNLPYMSASLPVDSAGFYAACGVAPKTDMSIHAASGVLLSDFATVQFDEGGVFSDGVFHASDEALWRQDFVLNSPGHRTARLTGVVTEVVGSGPVLGAVVQIVETELQAVTDASGAFSMANLPAGRVKISVRSPGMTVDLGSPGAQTNRFFSGNSFKHRAFTLAMGMSFQIGSAIGRSIGTSGPSRRPFAGQNVITRHDILTISATTAFQVVQRLHPEWLRARGRVSALDEDTDIVVYVNSTRRGGVDELRSISAQDIAEIRFMNARDVTTRFGLGHGSGAIQVIMGR